MPSLLIVDDLPAIHEMLTGLMGATGYLCAGASSGEEALMRYRQSRFDVVLIDYAMEPMDGLELARRLIEADPNVIIILMSGFTSEELTQDAIGAGIYLVIEKPIQVDSLMVAVERAYEESKVRRPRLRESEIENLPTLAEHLQLAEENYAGFVLDLCNGDKAKASKILGVDLG
ncbi:response regulator [Cerasicoccus fimbriatus]|uniref:response regulator n=1 Tax=Cerasicoccus fimbriatus TaxID=3014554 RepID=UPI0022B3E6A0|nr:response regulator [Cerasicoccus sp. TK19100]